MQSKEEAIVELKKIYRLRQLQGIIPFNMSFKEYVDLLKDLYGKN